MSKMINKFFSLVALFSLIFSIFATPALCDDAPAEKLTTSLKKGDKAPFEGVLLSIPLAAEIKNNCAPDVIQKRCDVKVNEAVSLCKSESQKELDIFGEKLKAQEEKYEKILKAKDEEIKIIRDQLKPPAWYEKPTLWFAVGVVAGGATVAYLVK